MHIIFLFPYKGQHSCILKFKLNAFPRIIKKNSAHGFIPNGKNPAGFFKITSKRGKN